MKQIARYAIVLVVLFGIVLLAKNKIAGASGPQAPANQATTATLRGFVWNDTDRDGVQDVGEAGLPNVTIDLYDSARAPVNTVITDATGRYQFENLAPGQYYVSVVPPAGYAISLKDQGQNDASDSDADPATGEFVLAELAAGENTLQWDAGLYTTRQPARPEPGTVRPPPAEVTVCENGIASVGGVSILDVDNLAPGYCLAAFLRSNAFAVGRIPDGAGTVLAPITFLRVFYNSTFVYEVPAADGSVQVCYALTGMPTQVAIYFYDFYGPRFEGGNGQPAWEPLPTTVEGNVACAAAQTSGAYALIGR
jgi:hypothetical protein